MEDLLDEQGPVWCVPDGHVVVQLTHAVLVCTVHSPTRYAVTGQLEHAAHTRSDVEVGARVSYLRLVLCVCVCVCVREYM